jgi:hypothetical protein
MSVLASMKTHLVSVTKTDGLIEIILVYFSNNIGPTGKLRGEILHYVTFNNSVHIDTFTFQLESEAKRTEVSFI